MLPVDTLDEKVSYVNALTASEGSPNSHWLINGPWINPNGNALDTYFPPESGFKPYYLQGKFIVAWQSEEVPMLRELVIPDTASYQRDAYSDWHYANGGTMLGLLSLFELSGDEKYYDFVRKFAKNLVDNYTYFRWQYQTLHAMRGSYHRIYRMTMLDDSGGPALPFAQLQVMEPGSEDLRPVLDLVYDYVMNGQERLEDRTFSRPEPEAATVWADDLFMSVPFLLRMARITGDEGLYDEVAHQVIRFHHYLSDPKTGLYFHGWFHNQGENTPVRWARANGWIVWATSEALLHMPKKHPEYKRILRIYREHMQALASYQDPSGMWHQVIDHPETFEESSSTAMFTLGLARGVRLGWLKENYKKQAIRGWSALQRKIGADGTVIDICRGTGIGEDVEFYENRKRFDHDPRGLGAMLTAGIEISLLLDP
jgi:rhamnogalacturonyl hydrolase YesR